MRAKRFAKRTQLKRGSERAPKARLEPRGRPKARGSELATTSFETAASQPPQDEAGVVSAVYNIPYREARQAPNKLGDATCLIEAAMLAKLSHSSHGRPERIWILKSRTRQRRAAAGGLRSLSSKSGCAFLPPCAEWISPRKRATRRPRGSRRAFGALSSRPLPLRSLREPLRSQRTLGLLALTMREIVAGWKGATKQASSP